MQNWSRLVLPIGLGIAAACVNASVLRNQIELETVVAVRRPISSGDVIREADLVEVSVTKSKGNQRHFWLWSERQNLLIGRSSATSLAEGDLVPRDVFLRDARPRFVVPNGHVVVCLRVGEHLVNSQLRYRLRPGRPVSVKLNHESKPVEDVSLAFLERVSADDQKSGNPDEYQIGLVVRNRPEIVSRLVEQNIASIEGSAE